MTGVFAQLERSLIKESNKAVAAEAQGLHSQCFAVAVVDSLEKIMALAVWFCRKVLFKSSDIYRPLIL